MTADDLAELATIAADYSGGRVSVALPSRLRKLINATPELIALARAGFPSLDKRASELSAYTSRSNTCDHVWQQEWFWSGHKNSEGEKDCRWVCDFCHEVKL